MPQLDLFHRHCALTATLAALTLLFTAVGCDKRTAEEKGRDYASKRVGFAQGVANVLEEKGKGLGLSAGKGVGELVKGAGAGVKDVVYAPVKVELDPGLTAAGLKLLQAHEGIRSARPARWPSISCLARPTKAVSSCAGSRARRAKRPGVRRRPRPSRKRMARR